MDFEKDVIDVIKQGRASGRKHNLIVVAEGVDMDVSKLAKLIKEKTGIDFTANLTFEEAKAPQK